ncbi:MAG: phosphate/phosphite/phosphonate ABC transporter substrate-binding protein [Phyllobacterium sp.]
MDLGQIRLCMGFAAAILTMPLAASAARADWREDIGTFRIGVISEFVASRSPREMDALTGAYSRALQMPVEFVALRDFSTLIDAQVSGRIDYAVHTALSYATMDAVCECTEPLAAPVDSDLATGIHAILIVRPGLSLTESELGSARISWPGGESAAGMLPLSSLKIGERTLTEVSSKWTKQDSAEAAEDLFAKGEIDGMFGWVPSSGEADDFDRGTVARLKEKGMDENAFQVLWTSPLLRYGPHAVRANLSPEAKKLLKQFLADLPAKRSDIYDLLDQSHGGGFKPVSRSDYRSAFRMVQMVTSPDQWP